MPAVARWRQAPRNVLPLPEGSRKTGTSAHHAATCEIATSGTGGRVGRTESAFGKPAYPAIAAGAERLLNAGHRPLGYARPHDERLAQASELRLKALRQVCAARGLPAPVALGIPGDDEGAQPAADAVAA